MKNRTMRKPKRTKPITHEHGILRNMASRLFTTILLVLSLSIVATHSYAAERHALVMGNSEYDAYNLVTSVNDANDMAAQLRLSGYSVFGGRALHNLDRLALERTIDEFAQSLPFGANAVIYFAGHGMATERDNYLLPINSVLEAQSQIKERAVSLRSIVKSLKSYNPGGVNVMLFDISRSNPLTSKFLGVENGFSKLNDLPSGTFIGYASSEAASSETVVANGIYTAQLVKAMSTSANTSITKFHKQVADAVVALSNGAQQPATDNSLFSEWCFIECSAVITHIVAKPLQPEATATASPVENVTVKRSRNYWMIAGGVILGVAAIAAAGSSGGSDSNPTVPIQLTPPGL